MEIPSTFSLSFSSVYWYLFLEYLNILTQLDSILESQDLNESRIIKCQQQQKKNFKVGG